jgi:hypothetical protein
MRLKEKLHKYITEHGFQKRWLGSQLGMKNQQWSQILGGHTPLPKRYWIPLIKLTNGKITFSDLIEETFAEVEFIEVKESKDFKECLLSLKYFNTSATD